MSYQQDATVPRLNAPVVLVHGISGFDRLFRSRRPAKEFFPGVRAHLESAGNRVLMPRVSATAGVRTRAAELAAYLRREVGTAPVHVIGHSMGGLDARYAVSRLGLGNQVLSLTTLGCPHRGSAFADWATERFGRLLFPLLRRLGVAVGAFDDLTTAGCARFNAETPDVPGVRYASVAGLIEAPWVCNAWKLSGRIVGRAEGPNDGIVSVASAGWGATQRVWRGDHLNLVNWPNPRMRKAGAWPDRPGEYAGLLAELKAEGY